MNLTLRVRVNDVIYCYNVLNGVSFNCIHLPNHFVIYLYKHHNHLYSYRAFFYNSLHIFTSDCDSKSKLFRAVQFLLQEEFYDVVQF